MKARWLGMMLGTGFVGVTALGGTLVGCSGGGDAQHEFDFTKASDRAQWQTEGLAYQGSVGPYAVFKVTASTQRLVGPSIAVGGGAVALASAQNYFVAAKTTANAAHLSLRAGSIVLLDATQTPMSDGQCTTGTTTTGGGDGADMAGGGASADMSGWGDPCKPSDMGGQGGGGSGGYGGGGSGGYGGGGSGGYGGGGSGGSGGSYGNPGGLPGGGWNNPGCPTDMGGGGSGGQGGGGSGGQGGGGSGGQGGGGSGGQGGGGSGGGSGESDSDLGAPPAPIYIDFPQPAPVGAVILIQHVTLGGGAAPRDSAPPVCCNGGQCTTGGGGGGSGSTGGGPIQ